MTPQEFIRKWSASTLRERAASQTHFNDLCAMLGVETPVEADPHGTWYTFDKGASKTTGGEGWADVWKRGYFAWEYKGKKKDLNAALVQLQQYVLALENPPLLIVSDMEAIVIHTNFTNTVHETHVIPLSELDRPENLQKLKWAFTEPERLKPGVTTQEITERAAAGFAEIAQKLRDRGHDPHRVAHFLNKVLFCMFAEDAGLLPKDIFTRLLETAVKRPEKLTELMGSLFGAMSGGGTFGVEFIEWFNGGLFDGDETLPLEPDEVARLLEVSRLDWSNIEPSIFGTLFERGLDPSKRSQLGAHFTDAVSIMRIVQPVVIDPLLAEWDEVKAGIASEMEKSEKARSKDAATKAWQKADTLYKGFLKRLAGFRVLDPACGSGNFLFLSLQSLKDLEHRVMLEAEQMGLHRSFFSVGPQCVLGIELNSYAAELARVTVWIGEIQWMLKHGFPPAKDPILKDLGRIANMDAVMDDAGGEPEWPEVDCIIGNPPFLGSQKLLNGLGDEYMEKLRALYKGRVPGSADLVTYWFEKARAMIEQGKAERAGLVATNSIRGGASRKVLERIKETATIFNAWSDEPWINEGAAVRVSLVCFGKQGANTNISLDGMPVAEIYADLTARNLMEGACPDLTRAERLRGNLGLCFMGITPVGPFAIKGEIAREWLTKPNPHGKPSSDVLRVYPNGMDVVNRKRDIWIIDFGTSLDEKQAALYEAPFAYVCKEIKPIRMKNNREAYRKYWWRHGESRVGMRTALAPLNRYIATPAVAKHRLFVWLSSMVLPDHQLFVFARDDDTAFGILHSRFHELWSLKKCTFVGVGNDPRYTPTTTFETFPFPEGLTPDIPATQYAGDPWAILIARAARSLNELRENWLNPPEWVNRVPEVVPGYPDRIIPIDARAAKELKKRTLTNLYNEKPAWLVDAHKELDKAVAAAYGWPDDLTREEVLRRLLELNLARQKK